MNQTQQKTAGELRRDAELRKLLAFAKSHGNEARIVGDAIEVDSEAHNVHTQAWTVETESARNMTELRAILGY